METLRQVLDPGFLSRNSVYLSLLVGLVCPLVGVYLVMRRLVFVGVALPQISSCGIALAFALPAWGVFPHVHDTLGERALALLGSLLFSLGAILLLSLLERRGRGLVEGRVGAAYVLAGAWSILLLAKNPHGEHGMLDLLRGEIIAVSNLDLGLTAGAFATVFAGLQLFRKEFQLVSFDREMALALKKNVLAWDALLFALIGLTVSMSVLSVGPLMTFGYLLLPTLTAYLFARTMRQLALAAAGIGGVSALAGFVIAYRFDLPVGPTDVALLGGVYGLAFVIRKVQAGLVRR